MKWRRGHQSSQVQDRRRIGAKGAGAAAVGGGGIIALLLALFMGGGGDGGLDLGSIFEQFSGSAGPAPSVSESTPDPDAELAEFSGFVLDDAQQMWTDVFAAGESRYPLATMVLFTGSTSSACGGATAAIGPHYCPVDSTVYLDLGFFEDLARRFGAPGDFAQAYVIAHEIGHHVQNVTGIMGEVRRLQEANPSEANDLSVRLELQADCFAGVWAYTVYAAGALEAGDLEEGLGAAEAVGDDRLQLQATGTMNQETWTHGSSEHRMYWFNLGYETGDPNSCDTFRADL